MSDFDLHRETEKAVRLAQVDVIIRQIKEKFGPLPEEPTNIEKVDKIIANIKDKFKEKSNGKKRYHRRGSSRE